MRTIKFLLCCTICTFISFDIHAQIKMAEFVTLGDAITVFPYDSLTNIKLLPNWPELRAKDRFKHLVGQKLTSIDLYFHTTFMKNYSYIRKKGSDIGWSRYNDNDFTETGLNNRTFVIDSVSYDAMYGYIFDMRYEGTNEKISIVVDDNNGIADLQLSCVCHGYYEKIKQRFLNKELVYIRVDKDNELYATMNKTRFQDYETNLGVIKKIPHNSIWKCTDVLVIPGRLDVRSGIEDRVILNLENEQYGKYYIYASYLVQSEYEKFENKNFVTLEEFNKYQAKQNELYALAKAKAVKAAEEAKLARERRKSLLVAKYGEKQGLAIFNGTLFIGMSKNQCIDAIGNPQRINRTTTASRQSEQWVYHNKYLYFENGVLTTIQD